MRLVFSVGGEGRMIINVQVLYYLLLFLLFLLFRRDGPSGEMPRLPRMHYSFPGVARK